MTVRPPEACGYNEATCSNKECIPKSKICDGQIDCSDGSDETRCSMCLFLTLRLKWQQILWIRLDNMTISTFRYVWLST